MFSTRFGKTIRVSRHARSRMVERQVSDEDVITVIEYGKIKVKDKKRVGLSHSFDDRDDNCLCLAIAVEVALVVKTVMINGELEETQ